jgi:hypothetical protein
MSGAVSKTNTTARAALKTGAVFDPPKQCYKCGHSHSLQSGVSWDMVSPRNGRRGTSMPKCKEEGECANRQKTAKKTAA